jgi:hypothetical protein
MKLPKTPYKACSLVLDTTPVEKKVYISPDVHPCRENYKDPTNGCADKSCFIREFGTMDTPYDSVFDALYNEHRKMKDKYNFKITFYFVKGTDPTKTTYYFIENEVVHTCLPYFYVKDRRSPVHFFKGKNASLTFK